MSFEFKPFPKIGKFGSVHMSITQKIHGTNAQVAIIPNPTTGELELYTGSRTRWIYPGDDNYGFAAFVHANKAEFIEKLGPGVHFGEWAGPGINSGEGLSEKTFVLFDFWRYPPERPLPPKCAVVPVLYTGRIDLDEVPKAMEDLKTNGSKLVSGFMRPEGVVVSVSNVRYKKVFEEEETQWTRGGVVKAPKDPQIDCSHLLQPIRLEKLLSRDERYRTEYPNTLPEVAKAYFEDLIAEKQIVGDEGQIKAIRKAAGSQVFNFIKKVMEDLNAPNSN